MFNGLLKAHSHQPPSRPQTPSLSVKLRNLNNSASDPEPVIEDDPQVLRFKALYEESEAKIASLFTTTGDLVVHKKRKLPPSFDAPESRIPDIIAPASQGQGQPHTASSAPLSKKRKIADNYDDYDDDEDDEDDADTSSASPLKGKSTKVQIVADPSRNATPIPRPAPPSRPASEASKAELAKQKQEKPEDARKALEEAKRREIETVKNMSRQFFFTLENDRDAMLDQQRLDEAERRAEVEAEGNANRASVAPQQGSLSSANLGASSLTLKNLIARIDMYRSEVNASESELRALMSEVRKNRSKWASEEKVGQEELYEAAEKVLNELKAQTEHSGPFLQPVKKKDAPDYHIIIKLPMDLGTMTKKLKQLNYKSKQDFTDDLHLIWTNCLKYNSSLEHPMRKHALFMRKETDKLVPLIPEIVIRDRAEIEAEERKQRIANGEFDDNAEDSDDDQPIMASRGRTAPGKKPAGTSKAPSASRKSVPEQESTPVPESKPTLSQINALTSGGRADSDADIGSQGHSTPPPGMLTPTGIDKGAGSVVDAASEAPDAELPGLPDPNTPPELEDDDYRLWKQKTKKERAMIASARHKLFRGDRLNADEEAILRNKASMRRWQRLQPGGADQLDPELDGDAKQTQAKPTLAENLEPEEEESMLPDYYDSSAAIPELNPRLRWETDADGQLIDQNEEDLRLYPSGMFVAPSSLLTQKMSDNMRQIQETRKIVSKIGVVKQMQLQTQVYQNQFQKYEPAPFFEEDVQNVVVSDDGPLMAPWVAKAALTRSIGEVFFHAGFEEFQPSAIDVVADLAANFFSTLCSNLNDYMTEERTNVLMTDAVDSQQRLSPLTSHDHKTALATNMSQEEAVLHTLRESGLSVNDLDYYAREEMDRTSTKLQTMYDRMRSHYADLLKPAMTDDTAQGSGSFDSGEQYTSGDFADDLGEDFFGFKELGLDKEFGLVNLSVPLHLLHSRIAATSQQTSNTGDAAEKIFIPPPPFARVNVENIEREVGLVREHFKKLLKTNGDRPLPEDQDLPVKQRKGYGRAKIPATGKIEGKNVGGSPQKKAGAASATKSDAKNVKLTLTNGTKKDEPKARKDSTVSRSGDTNMADLDADATADFDAEADEEQNGPPTPTRDVDVSPEKKTPTKSNPLKQRPGDIRKNSSLSVDMSQQASMNGHQESSTNGDFSAFVNGIDSPPPSANGNEDRDSASARKKKGKVKVKGNDDGMISPESL